MDREILAKANK